jgi:hypothetical protein
MSVMKPDDDGKFGTGSVGAASHHQTKMENGKRLTTAGEALPKHIEALKIPPAWTDVTFSPDPKADLLATGKDSKGRHVIWFAALMHP